MIWLILALGLGAVSVAGIAYVGRRGRRRALLVAADLADRLAAAVDAYAAATPWQPATAPDAPPAAGAIEAALIKREPRQALELAESALVAAADPSPPSRVWLAWALCANGQPRAALDQLAKAGVLEAPPPGDGTAPPPGDGSVHPPGDGTAPPPGDGSVHPPGDGTAPPPGDRTAPPPGDRIVHPPGDGTVSPPGDRIVPTPGDRIAPPPGDRIAPPPGDRVVPTLGTPLALYVAARAEHLHFEHNHGATGAVPPLVTTGDLAVVTLARGRGSATWLAGPTDVQLSAAQVIAAIAEHRELTARCLGRALDALAAAPGFTDAAYLAARLAVKAGVLPAARRMFDALAPRIAGRPDADAFERDRRDLADPTGAVEAARQPPPPTTQARRPRSLRVLK